MTSHDPIVDTAVSGHHTIAQDLATLRDDFGKLSQTVAGLISDQAETAGHNLKAAVGSVQSGVSSTAEHARDAVVSTARDAGSKATTYTRQLEASIERNPLTAVILAVGAGIIAGMIGSARR